MTGKNKKRGFSLIEAAIVLAVVGLVLGGIWIAAAAMYETYKVNKYAEGILSIYRCVKNKFPRLECDSILCKTVDLITAWKQTKFFDDVGCIPNEIFLRKNGGYYDYFSGKNVSVVLYGGVGNLHIHTRPKTVSQCAKLANRIARIANAKELNFIQVGIHIYPNYKNITLKDFTSYCLNNGTDVFVNFNF